MCYNSFGGGAVYRLSAAPSLRRQNKTAKAPGDYLSGVYFASFQNSCEFDVILLIFTFQYGSTLNNVKFYNTFYIPIWDY
jgi:hypothetical protein|nr:MAG TPA: hypothetical protein [Caudoviricetes sp.]